MKVIDSTPHFQFQERGVGFKGCKIEGCYMGLPIALTNVVLSNVLGVSKFYSLQVDVVTGFFFQHCIHQYKLVVRS